MRRYRVIEVAKILESWSAFGEINSVIVCGGLEGNSKRLFKDVKYWRVGRVVECGGLEGNSKRLFKDVKYWRVGRVVECGGLENRYRRKSIRGSNP